MSSRRHDQLTILQITGEYPPDPGGVGDYTRLLSRALIARGHRVTVLTGRRSAVEPAATDADPPVLTIPGDWSWRSARPLLAAIARRRPDIVHIQYQTGAYAMRPAINVLPAMMRRLAARPRVVVTAHDLRLPYLFPRAGALRHWVTRRLLADADAVIVTNAADRDALAGRGDLDPELFRATTPIAATVIPIGSNITPDPPRGYDRAAWRRAAGVGDDDIVAAFFGLASPTKGLLPAVQALADLPTSIRLLVVGGEAHHPADRHYLLQVRAAVDELGIADRVAWTGYCDQQTVSAHLLSADIGLLPFTDGASYRRGSLLALLAHGLPIVTTRPSTPLDPPFVDGEHGLLVPPAAPRELGAAVVRLAQDHELRARLSRGGRALAAGFAWPTIAAAHEDVYNTVLSVE